MKKRVTKLQIERWLLRILYDRENVSRRYESLGNVTGTSFYVPGDLQEWWEKKRKAYTEWLEGEKRAAAARKEKLRASGLAKLTEDEKKALDI